MVGLDIFKEYFADFTNNYVIIGGAARDIIMEEAGFRAKGTKDIDLILVVEALNADFVKKFWGFIKDGGYEVREKSEEDRKYYRFNKPSNDKFPSELELFSRNPDLLDFEEGVNLTPIPVEDALTSLSAILLDDQYYQFILEHSNVEDGLHLAKKEAIICLKAKAYIDMTQRKAEGETIDSRKIRKHNTDIFRLAVTLVADDSFDLPETVKEDLQQYIEMIKNNLPPKAFFKSIGMSNINSEEVYLQILKSFQLDE